MIKAMTVISSEHYTCNDTTICCEPTVYIQTIIQHRKIAALLTQSVFVIAYQNVNSELHHNLNNLIKTSVLLFVKDMKSKKPIWFDLYL